jgi:hypothetical protein
MVLTKHIAIWNKIFQLPGFFSNPFLMFGYQEMSSDFDQSSPSSFKQYLQSRKVYDVTVIDYDDDRADIHLDMNHPLPKELKDEKFKVVADIGCLEHVLNTKQCLENCISMVEKDGLYLLHTPVSGYFRHGFHVFNPDMLRWFLKQNGFRIVFDCYSSKEGEIISQPKGDTLLWIVAQKIEDQLFINIPIDNHGKIECKIEKR